MKKINNPLLLLNKDKTSLKEGVKVSDLSKKAKEFLDQTYGIKFGEEAQHRNDYVSAIEYIVGGAAGEFYKCRINDKLKSKHTDRAHWEKEWRGLLGKRLSDQFNRKVKSISTLDGKLKAFDTAMNNYQEVDRNYRITAANTMAKYLNLSSIKLQKVLEPKDTNDFLNEVSIALDFIVANSDNLNAFQKEPEVPWNQKPKKTKKKY